MIIILIPITLDCVSRGYICCVSDDLICHFCCVGNHGRLGDHGDRVHDGCDLDLHICCHDRHSDDPFLPSLDNLGDLLFDSCEIKKLNDMIYFQIIKVQGNQVLHHKNSFIIMV